jgi:type VI secretion system protein ImpK
MSKSNVVLRQRSNNLALAFQDVVTATLRVRYLTQRVADAAAFRESIGKMIAAGVQDSRSIGYSPQTLNMARFAVVAFLDESVLNLQDPTFSDWAAHPLQEEMFRGQPAAETFFRHITDLLNQPESVETSDVLELHATCLLLGYRGNYPPGDDGDIEEIVRRIRERMARSRGPVRLCRASDAPAVQAQAVPAGDPWLRRFALVTACLLMVVVLIFAGYWYLLNRNLNSIQTRVEQPSGFMRTASALGRFDGGFAR